MVPILKLFSSVLTQLINLVKKSLHKYNFLALSAYEGLLSLQRHWEDVLSRRGSAHTADKNELKDGLQSLRALCLRSFPEFLADVKMGAMSRGADTNTKLMDFTTSVGYILFFSGGQLTISSLLDNRLYRTTPSSAQCRGICTVRFR